MHYFWDNPRIIIVFIELIYVSVRTDVGPTLKSRHPTYKKLPIRCFVISTNSFIDHTVHNTAQTHSDDNTEKRP